MIGVIADDLTGAAEIGAAGLRHGLRAEVVITGEPDHDADLVCVDTDSRSYPPAEAAQRVAAATRMLHNNGASWIYKKTDSVLRGNVTPEIEAIIEQLELSGALLIPANPSLGRTIVNGRYFVGGRPVHETDFARDPQHPRLSSNVIELLDQPASLPISVGKPDGRLPERGIVVGEVSTSEDVRAWTAQRAENWLMAGGAEFFGALLGSHAQEGRVTRVPNQNAGNKYGTLITRPSERELFVCGSMSAAARSFVETQALRGVPVISLPEKLSADGDFSSRDVSALAEKATDALQTRQRVILNIGLPPVADRALAALLAQHLVSVAEGVLRRCPVNHVFAEGGATAVALARRMGWARLKVTAELAPGVAALTVTGEKPILFTIKPGSYTWPEVILKGER